MDQGMPPFHRRHRIVKEIAKVRPLMSNGILPRSLPWGECLESREHLAGAGGECSFLWSRRLGRMDDSSLGLRGGSTVSTGLFCNRTFDDYACWPDGPPGSFVNVSCPWYLPWASSGEWSPA